MKYFASQSFQGLTIQSIKNEHTEKDKFFLGGSSAGRLAVVQNPAYLYISDVTPQMGETRINKPLDFARFAVSAQSSALSFLNGKVLAYEKKQRNLDAPDRYKLRRKAADFNRVSHAVYFVNGNEFKISCNYKKYREITGKKMSRHTKQKISNKIQAFNYLAESMGEKLKFVTLTFISQVNDEQAKKILNTYLTQIRKIYADFSYLWVAEKQKNGNLHYHLFTQKYLPVKRFNLLWVRCQFNAGVGFHGITKFSHYRKAVERGSIKGLNPFDVQVIKDVHGAAAYVVKYVTKNDTEMNTSLWHCSRSVSILGTSTVVPINEVKNHLNERLNFTVDKKTGEIFDVKRTYLDDNGNQKSCYTYAGKFFYYIKTLNKKRLHHAIKNYITNLNRKVFAIINQINDLRHENELLKRLSQKRKMLIHPEVAKIGLQANRDEIKALKNRMYKIIPLFKTWDLIESPGFSWN